MKKIVHALMGGLFLYLPTTAMAQNTPGFYPTKSCGEIVDSDNTTKFLAGAWVMGYLAARQDDPSLVNVSNVEIVYKNLEEICNKNRSLTLLDLVQGSKKPGADSPGSEANARVMLEKFLKPGADYVALTAALFPTADDVRTVFKEPLASAIIKGLLPQLKPGLSFRPHEGQSELLTAHAMTDDLKNGLPVLQDFPGGYKDILPYLKPGIPVVRFKFVKPGETLGLAFDGLFYVNGRWVIIPKSWGYLD